ncbi:MAG: transglycosylase SLT domain-containing protein [Acidimicrobiia bacterium]|nr:transglycosylase SLT domain-containing protein [Acidimicrobiia bacterium]MDH5290626.1 transglycosylase SLT domain-containing protein [Acidimicrobiia bacterium]
MSGSFGFGSTAGAAHMPERMAAIQTRFGLSATRPAPSPGRAVFPSTFDTVLADARSSVGGETAASPEARLADALGADADADGGWPLLVGATLPAGLLNALGTDVSSPAGPGIDARSELGGTGPSGGAASPGEAVVAAAAAYLGVPYLWGGTDPDRGLDCSGLIQLAYRQAGVEMPKWSRNQATMGVAVDSIDQALPGDILTFGHPVRHVALYVGDGKMLHAPKRGEVVKIEPIDRPIGAIRRIITPGGAPEALGAGADPAASGAPAPSSSTVQAGPAEQRYQALFVDAGRRWNVDPNLLAAVAQTESGFNPHAKSPAGAQGLMQFMPATAAEMGVDPWDPASAIDGAARYLRTSLDRFGSTELAVASYNAGRGAVARYGDVPPYRETRVYVNKVLDAWKDRS